MRIGQPFNGIVLSSETKTFISSVDASLAEQYGVAGINCSWNRLKEIPFQSLGRDRNQRILPFLLAANSINYGRPFKLNTAEAIAAALYIMGFKEDAYYFLSSFNYGAEFFRMNAVELELYSRCKSSVEVEAANSQVMMRLEAKKDEKERRREEERRGCGISTSYLGEMDLPPDFDEEEYEEEEEELEKEKSVVGPSYSEEESSTA